MSTLVVLLLAVGVGGAAGSVLRWAIKEAWLRRLARRGATSIAAELIPWPTIFANILACFLLGIIVTEFGAATEGSARALFLLLSAGFCGGLSTLSTAAMDVVSLVRRGAPVIAAGYLMVSVGIGMAALWSGLMTAQLFGGVLAP